MGFPDDEVLNNAGSATETHCIGDAKSKSALNSFMPVPAIIISTNIWQKSISVPMPLPNSAPVIKEVISLLYPWDGG